MTELNKIKLKLTFELEGNEAGIAGAIGFLLRELASDDDLKHIQAEIEQQLLERNQDDTTEV